MKRGKNVGWLREAISDREGLADMAYIAIGLLALGALAALAFVASMSAIDYYHCINTPITTISKGDQSTTSVIPCRYDPLPFGQAAGLIFTAFAALIGSLSAYMVATRRKDGPPVVVQTGQQPSTVVTT